MTYRFSDSLIKWTGGFTCLLALAILVTGCGLGNDVPMADPLPDSVQAKHKTVILEQANLMQQKLLGSDLDGFLTYLDPEVLEKMGGAEKVKEAMSPGLAQMVDTVQEITIGEVSEVCEDGDRLVALFPVTLHCLIGDENLVQIAYRIACSRDGGKSWTFMESQGRQEQEDFFEQTFPIFAKRVSFPACSVKKVDKESVEADEPDKK